MTKTTYNPQGEQHAINLHLTEAVAELRIGHRSMEKKMSDIAEEITKLTKALVTIKMVAVLIAVETIADSGMIKFIISLLR